MSPDQERDVKKTTDDINPIHALREREVVTYSGRGGRSQRSTRGVARVEPTLPSPVCDTLLFTEEDLVSFRAMENAIYSKQRIRVIFQCYPLDKPTTERLEGQPIVIFGYASEPPMDAAPYTAAYLKSQLRKYLPDTSLTHIEIVHPTGRRAKPRTKIKNLRFPHTSNEES